MTDSKKSFFQQMYTEWRNKVGTNAPVWHASEEMGMAIQDASGERTCEEILSEETTRTETTGLRQYGGRPTVNLEQIERRLSRLESRLVQLMLHLGADPYRTGSGDKQEFDRQQPKVYYRDRPDNR